MFDLEQSITEWRKKMLAAGIKSPVPLEELESHLREEIEGLIKSGTSEEQAFAMAIRQIGQGKELKTEFSKTSRMRDILEMELIKKDWDLKWGPVLHLTVTTGLLFFIGGAVLFDRDSQMTPVERMSSLAALAVFYSVSCAGYLGHKFFPVIPNPKMRLAIYAAGTVLISVWLMIFLLEANYSIRQFSVRFMWAFLVPLGAFSGLVLGLERAANKKVKAAAS